MLSPAVSSLRFLDKHVDSTGGNTLAFARWTKPENLSVNHTIDDLRPEDLRPEIDVSGQERAGQGCKECSTLELDETTIQFITRIVCNQL